MVCVYDVTLALTVAGLNERRPSKLTPHADMGYPPCLAPFGVKCSYLVSVHSMSVRQTASVPFS